MPREKEEIQGRGDAKERRKEGRRKGREEGTREGRKERREEGTYRQGAVLSRQWNQRERKGPTLSRRPSCRPQLRTTVPLGWVPKNKSVRRVQSAGELQSQKSGQ